MFDTLRKLYGAGIIFFYYFKYPIVIGLPILYYGLDYSQNMVMNILWLYSLLLIFKDISIMLIRYLR